MRLVRCLRPADRCAITIAGKRMTSSRIDRLPSHGSPQSAVTSHDVARAAGVSQSTVSRALRKDPRISTTTRERVLAAVTELGYVPSEVGRSLVTRSTRTIGIVVTDLSSVFYPFLVAPLQDEVAAHDYRMLLFTDRSETAPNGKFLLRPALAGDHEPAAERASQEPGGISTLLDRLLDRTVSGAVLTTSLLDGPISRELSQRSLPFVFLTRFVDGVHADVAVVDNSLGASLAAAEAVRLGHTRIGSIFGPINTSTGRDRERGIRAALTAAGVPLADSMTRWGPFSFESGYATMTELMREDPPPTVVLCANDAVAIGAYNAALTLGLSVPDDVSLVGFDDLPMAGWEVFGLTTVHQPMEEMARTAVQLLIERIEGGAAATEVRQRVFEPTLVIRRTLAPPSH
jgi:LacI family transcriptional regulator